MARMHSRDGGKSGSTKPINKVAQPWVVYKGKEIELLIVKLAKEDKSSSEIGIILRDSYGIHDVKTICKKSISAILKDKKLGGELPDDLLAMVRKSVAIRKHMEANGQDQTAKRGLRLTESKINRLVRYYKRTGALASDWKFDPARAGFYMK